MATKYKHIPIPIPYRGINSDTSPSQIGPEYCVSARNVILNEPGHLRTRTGWKRMAGYGNILTSSTTRGVEVLGAVTYDDPQSLTTKIMVHQQDVADSYVSDYQAGFGHPFTSTPGTTRMGVVSVDYSGGTYAAATGSLTNAQPIGNTVRYNDVVYGVQFDSGGSTGRPFMWAGTNNASNTTGGVTINNGSTAGTFSSAPASSMKNMFLLVNTGGTGPLSGYTYRYRIVEHTAAAASFTLSEPYGLGENTTNVPNAVGATTTIAVQSLHLIPMQYPGYTSTFGVGCVGLFRDRLFTGRRTVDAGGLIWSGNRIDWSKPGYPNKGAAANFIYLPTNEMIMGMATVPDALLIFTQTQTFILTGYDESSFSLSRLSGEVGCIHSASICYYKNRAYWASEQGVFYSDGGAPQSLTQPSPGMGIRSDYLNIVAAVNGTRSQATKRNVSAAIIGDTYVLAAHVFNSAGSFGPVDAFACDLRSGTWTRWGNTTQAQGYYQPQVFAQTPRQVFAITPWQTVDVSGCFNPEGIAAPALNVTDEDYTATPSSTTSTITASITFADMRIGTDAVKLRGIQFEHNCQYFNATSSPRAAWSVTMDTDSELDSSPTSVGTISARYIGNVTAPLPAKYYTTTFRDTAALDGATFRVSLDKTAATHSAKIYRIYLLTDAQPTSISRVDNPTL